MDDEAMVGDRINRNICRFLDRLNAGYGAHDVANAASVAERRRIAELVRAERRSGGPAVART